MEFIVHAYTCNHKVHGDYEYTWWVSISYVVLNVYVYGNSYTVSTMYVVLNMCIYLGANCAGLDRAKKLDTQRLSGMSTDCGHNTCMYSTVVLWGPCYQMYYTIRPFSLLCP